MFWFVITFVLYYYECYTVAKSIYLRKNDDIYMDELVAPITTVLKAGYAFKMLFNLLVLIYISGSNHTKENDFAIVLELGL